MLEEYRALLAKPATTLCLNRQDRTGAHRVRKTLRRAISSAGRDMMLCGPLIIPIGVRLRKCKERLEINVEAVCLAADPVDYLAGWRTTRSCAINALKRCAAHPQVHFDRLREPGERASFHRGWR